MAKLASSVSLKILGAQVGVVLLSPLLLPLALFGYLGRWLIFSLGQIRGHDFVTPVNGPDLKFISDTKTKPHSTFCFVFSLQGSLKLKTIEKELEKLYNLRSEKGSRIFWKLGTTPVKYFGYWFWEKVQNFQIKNQIHLCENIEKNEGLCQLVDQIQRKHFSKDGPRWDLTIFQDHCAEKTFAIYRMSHSIMDGYSAVKMCFRICGLNALPSDVAVDKRTSRSNVEKIKLLCLTLTQGLREYLKIWYSVPEKNIFTERRLEGEEFGLWFHALTSKISLKEVKAARKAFGTSFYSVVLSAIVGAMRNLAENEFGEESIPEYVKTMMPMSKPIHPDNTLCNHWRPVMVDIPLRGSSNLSKTIGEIDKAVQSFTGSIASEFTELVFDILSLLPIGPWINEITKFEGLTFVSSLSVWSNESLEMFDREIEECFYFMPIPREKHASFAWGAMSSKESLRIGLTAERLYFPNPNILTKFSLLIEQEFQKIFKLAREKNIHLE